MNRVEGLVKISEIRGSAGDLVSIEDAMRYGWLKFDSREAFTRHQGDGLPNLFLDQGRQLLVFAFGFRAPIENYVCGKFGVGTGTTAARVTDLALETPITLASGDTTGPVDSIDFLSAFVVRVAFTLGANDANGYAITEQGLFSGNDTIMARRVNSVAINKTSDFAPTLTWRLRF